MSINATPEERAVLAGEYVLGTLDARTARAVERAMETDTALRNEVAVWEAQLAPLSTLATPEAPPPNLWARIEAGITPKSEQAPAAVMAPAPRRGLGLAFWRGWSLASTALAAGLAGLLLIGPQGGKGPGRMAVLTTDRNAQSWIVEATATGGLIFVTNSEIRAPEGRVLQLWVLPPGAAGPTTLGLLPEGHRGFHQVASIPLALPPGTLVEMTIEPPGGSPEPRPTGPVAFIGRLMEVPNEASGPGRR